MVFMLRNFYTVGATILCLCLSLDVHAQGQVLMELRDKITGVEIVDAVIEVASNESNTDYYTTDEEGQVLIEDTEIPFQVIIQHLSYDHEQLIIDEPGERAILLEPRNLNLEGIVVTGQYFAQSAQNSVYRVNSIGHEDITAMAGSDLSEVLSFSQNLKLDRDQNTNGNQLNFLGIGGNNVKILLDGMPMAGRTALEFDVSQINLSNVERIEIVEGPMSVEYGSNALAGVVNVITKKHTTTPNLGLKLQEESMGSAYGWDEGVHDLSLVLNNNLLKHIASTATLEYKQIGGAVYLDGDSRATEWDPKSQVFGDIKLRTQINKADISYRVSFYHDWIDNLGIAEGPLKNRATDDHYKARRWNQHLSFGKYFDRIGRMDAKVSYSDYKRIKNTFITDLYTDVSTLSMAEGAQNTSVFRNFSLWTHYTTTAGERLKIKSGLDFQYDFTDGGRILEESSRSSIEAALFSTAEYNLLKDVTIKPGLRWAYNNRFSSPIIPSIHVLYKISDNASLRGGYARGFRAPALREMFFEFVDNSHTIYGNPDLMPEESDYLDLSYTSTHLFNIEAKQKFSSRFFYTKVKDQITFAQDLNDPSITTLLNNDLYKAFGLSFTQQLLINKIEVSAGAGFIAQNNQYSSSYATEDYLYSMQITGAIKSYIMNTPLRLISNFKYNGKEPTYVLVDIGSEQKPELVNSDSYMTMDVLLQYKFSDQLSIGAGVKNLFDVEWIKVVDDKNYHAGGGDVPIGYGRSGFFRLNYSFNLK